MAQMGRPRTFDRDEAVQQAMNLFWEHGYDSTSVSLLKANMGGGITAPSFYAAFGSKEELFREVVDRYVATHGQVNASLWDESLSPREAIELSLRRSAKMQTERSHPKGCLLVLSASACSPAHEHIQKLLAKQRARTRDAIQKRVQEAVDAKELPVGTEVRAYAMSLYGFLLGLSVMAREGMPSTVLDAAVTETMCGWDARAAVSKA